MATEKTYTIQERLREGRTNGTALCWMVTPIHTEAADVIDALVEALERALTCMESVDGENDCSKAIAVVEAALSRARGDK